MVTNSLKNMNPLQRLSKLERASREKRFLTTSEAAKLTGYAQDHIGLMLRIGKLVGEKPGRDWLIDPKSLTAYVKSKPKAGRRRA